jgi:hypothetical protein
MLHVAAKPVTILASLWQENVALARFSGTRNGWRRSMVASREHVTPSTPMGANLIADGATFRAWAPGALHVHVELGGPAGFQPRAASRASPMAPSTGSLWGPGGSGFKRDPWARELELEGDPDYLAHAYRSAHAHRRMMRHGRKPEVNVAR